MSDDAADFDRMSSLKRAALALQQARARIEELEREQNEPIAVVGIGCRFPGAEGPDAYFNLIEQGKDAIREIPTDRFDVDLFFDPDLGPGKMSTRWAGLIDNIDRFDPGFFGISAGEACAMDPQQRLVLEVVWEALEHAAIAPDSLSGTSTGVFVGASHSDYFCLLKGAPSRAGTGIELSIIANRVSYLLNLRGPSFTVDTACSSSLLAVHLASRSLRARECDVAIAGGVGVILRPELTIGFSQAGMMAPDGRCKTFDAAANGYVRGEGCGFVILKRRSDAIAANDTILALIRGSATNQDGRSNGLTSPNGGAQKDVIRAALASANVAPDDIGYLETHGTGTSLGDAVEVGALKEVFGRRGDGVPQLVLGAVKTNIGHLEAAAGIAGLIKTVLCLDRRVLPPVLHFHSLNPTIAREGVSFVIPTRAVPWPEDQRGRFAGVSGFSFGGANVHVVVEGVDPAPSNDADGPIPSVLAISAKDPKTLGQIARRLADDLTKHERLSIRDVCAVLARGRTHFSHRAAFAVESIAEAVEALRAFAAATEAGSALPAGRASDSSAFIEAREAALAYSRGAEIDWSRWTSGTAAKKVHLPSYPFQRNRYWLGPDEIKRPTPEPG
jgi:acyl transferase domain-containing protein